MKSRRREYQREKLRSRDGEAFVLGRWDLRDFMDAQDGSCGMVNRKEKPRHDRSLCFLYSLSIAFRPMLFQCLLLNSCWPDLEVKGSRAVMIHRLTHRYLVASISPPLMWPSLDRL